MCVCVCVCACARVCVRVCVCVCVGQRSWLRHCATSWKVTDFILDEGFEIFYSLSASGCRVALGSTQHLTEMITRALPWGVKTASA